MLNSKQKKSNTIVLPMPGKGAADSPVWKVMYKQKWMQITDIIDTTNLKILDFGSGGGITANYFAKNNDVVAIEPREEMIKERKRENSYIQIQGNHEKLKDFPDGSFDVIVCHNVLEFAADNDERITIVNEFSRLLKKDGILSVIKNNGIGRIIRIAAANKIDDVLCLLNGGYVANDFGTVDLYDPEDLIKWGNDLEIVKILAVNTFNGLLHNEDINNDPKWEDKMLEIEMRVANSDLYKSFSLFHHVLIRKLS